MPGTVQGSEQRGQMEMVLFLLGFPLGELSEDNLLNSCAVKRLIPDTQCHLQSDSDKCHTVALQTPHVTLWPYITDPTCPM